MRSSKLHTFEAKF